MTTTPEPGTTEAGERERPVETAELADMRRDAQFAIATEAREITDHGGASGYWAMKAAYGRQTLRLITEVESLKAQLVAAQAERDQLKQEHADMHGYCSAEPGHCPHEAQLEQQRTETQAAQDVVEAVKVLFGRRGTTPTPIHHPKCTVFRATVKGLACDCGASEIRAALARLDQPEATESTLTAIGYAILRKGSLSVSGTFATLNEARTAFASADEALRSECAIYAVDATGRWTEVPSSQ